MYKSNNLAPLIILKDDSYVPFVAFIKDFSFEEEATKVIFTRCPQTEKLPNEPKGLRKK